MNRQVIRTVYRVKDGVAGVIHTDPVMVPVKAPEKKALSYEEFIALAGKHYTKGGDVAVVCKDVRPGDSGQGPGDVQTVEITGSPAVWQLVDTGTSEGRR